MNTHQETGKLKWSRNRGYTSNSNKEGKEPIMKSLTVNRSHFSNRFICRPVAVVLICTASGPAQVMLEHMGSIQVWCVNDAEIGRAHV